MQLSAKIDCENDLMILGTSQIKKIFIILCWTFVASVSDLKASSVSVKRQFFICSVFYLFLLVRH